MDAAARGRALGTTGGLRTAGRAPRQHGGQELRWADLLRRRGPRRSQVNKPCPEPGDNKPGTRG